VFFSKTVPQEDKYYEGDVVTRDLGSGHDSLVQRIAMVTQRSRYDDRIRRPTPDAPDRSTDLGSERVARNRPSIGRRILRTVSRFCFVFLIGVSATLAWQSYHEEAKDLVRTLVPTAGLLLPPLPASAEPSFEVGRQLKAIVFDLALVRRGIEQLAADQKQLSGKQDQIAHDVSMLQAIGRDLSQNISSAPPSGIVQHKPPQAPAQSLAVQ
jgi:hypothetical protein